MKNRDITTLLRLMKDTEKFGGNFNDEKMEKGRLELLCEIGVTEDFDAPKYSFSDRMQYAYWWTARSTARPAAVMISSFLIIFSGWIFTVNATYDTVPGDILYPVKLATEKVRLTLTTDTYKRAKLHTEFATRRLAEVVEISESSSFEGKDARIKEAVDSFRSEVSLMNVELENMDQNNASEAAELAVAMNRKVSEFEAVVEKTNIDNVAEELSVDSVGPIIEEANQQLAETMITKHEASQAEETDKYLKDAFQADLKNIRNRLNLSLGRIQVIESVLVNNELENEEDYSAQIEDIKNQLHGFDEALSEAMDLYAAGGYRKVLESISELKQTLSGGEAVIGNLEIEISTSLFKSTEPETIIETTGSDENKETAVTGEQPEAAEVSSALF